MNPASVKQALMASARRLPGFNIFEQGTYFLLDLHVFCLGKANCLSMLRARQVPSSSLGQVDFLAAQVTIKLTCPMGKDSKSSSN